jgi:iron complex transport system permease protein
MIVIFATLSTAAAVTFTGVIGFVGLIVPHILRRVTGGDMRRLLPLSMIGGAIFLLLADIIARVLISPQELPVGIITSLFGAPFFLFILRRSKGKDW